MKHSNWYVNLIAVLVPILCPGFHLHRDPPTAEEKKAKQEAKRVINRVEDYTNDEPLF